MTDSTGIAGARTGLATFWAAIKGHPIKTFVICVTGLVLSAMDQALYSYAMPGITAEFNVGLDVVGDILSASFLAASIGVVAAGTLTDYFGRRRMFITLTAVSALCVGSHALASSIGWLAFFRILGFALAAGTFPISATIIVEVSPARYRGILSGWLQMSYPVGFAVAAAISSQVLAGHSWRVSFYPAFAVIPLIIWLGSKLKETDRFQSTAGAAAGTVEAAQGSRSLKDHFAELMSPQYRARALILFTGTIIGNLAIGGASFFLPTFLIEDRGLSESAAAGLLQYSWLIAATGYLASSYIGEFVTTRRNTYIGVQWLGAICLGLTIWFAHSPIALLLGFGISTMFFFSSECVRMPLSAEIFPTRIRTTAAAVTGSTAVTLATVIAPLAIPALVKVVGWTWTFTLIGVIPLFLTGCIFLALENFKSGVEVETLSN